MSVYFFDSAFFVETQPIDLYVNIFSGMQFALVYRYMTKYIGEKHGLNQIFSDNNSFSFFQSIIGAVYACRFPC